jgi:hypothetical protein
MKPLTPNQRAAKALTAMRDARGAGATDAAIIAAGELAAGGDDAAKITDAIWRNKFLIMGAN